jgi:hypothetical protein
MYLITRLTPLTTHRGTPGLIASHVETSIHEANSVNLPLKANGRDSLKLYLSTASGSNLVDPLKFKLRCKWIVWF